MKFDYYIASNAAVPHVALVMGSDSVDPGEAYFTVPYGERFVMAQVLITSLAEVANKYNAVLDHLIHEHVDLDDLPEMIKDIENGLVPFLRPEKVTAESLDEVVENVIGRSPADLAGYAASAALNELLPNWKQALDEGTNIKELTSDIDDLVLLLNNFKAFCTEKQVPAVLSGSLLNDVRRAYAEKCFADYDFKNLHVVDSSGWEVEGNQWYQSVYAEMVDADEGGSPITPLSFKVKFDEGSTTPRDCYAYDSSGSMI